jgi:endo-alpha-1,4-polygalactosaminidase (GH114 family)
MDTMNIHFDLLFIDSSYQEFDCISLDSFSIHLKKIVGHSAIPYLSICSVTSHQHVDFFFRSGLC